MYLPLGAPSPHLCESQLNMSPGALLVRLWAGNCSLQRTRRVLAEECGGMSACVGALQAMNPVQYRTRWIETGGGWLF